MVKLKKFSGRNFFRHKGLTESGKMNSHWTAVLVLNRNICRERPIVCWRMTTSQLSERPVNLRRTAVSQVSERPVIFWRTANFKISEQPTFVSETSPDTKNFIKNYTNCLKRAGHRKLRDSSF